MKSWSLFKSSRLMDQMHSGLSREETQRLALCVCLRKRAHIYLIDKPSAYLSPQQRDVALRVIKRFVTLFNQTAFVVEHDLTTVEHLADKDVVFKRTPSIDCVANAP
nr:ABC transporter E family member 2-like [Tanacetum cinerariifolium]